jgi:adenylyltransferase/sulfurtransferase
MTLPSIASGGPRPASQGDDMLSPAEVSRYHRHLILPEVGMAGQRKLKSARVLLVGAGGLGSPAATYLAAAGVGHLGIVDFDLVDVSNLQRQILFGSRDVGSAKVDSARDRLGEINPHVDVATYRERLTSHNALEILGGYDIVVDGTDNFPTRYLVNDACVALGKPNVYGSIFRFEGQASVFATKGGACYRCLYPEPPPPASVPSCAEAGVLGVLPGIVGSIQANETIKLILGADTAGGRSLVNRLLLFNAWNMQFRELKLHKDPRCPACGEHATIKELIDYEQFCGLAAPATAPLQGDITATELKRRIDLGMDVQLIDVREPYEFEVARLPGSKLIPLAEVVERQGEIDANRQTVVYCKHGIRSAQAITWLHEDGFSAPLLNLRGGIVAWTSEVDPSLPRY